jgi:hypothetical protein
LGIICCSFNDNRAVSSLQRKAEQPEPASPNNDKERFLRLCLSPADYCGFDFGFRTDRSSPHFEVPNNGDSWYSLLFSGHKLYDTEAALHQEVIRLAVERIYHEFCQETTAL